MEVVQRATRPRELPGVWGPILGPHRPISSLPHPYNKAESPYPLRTSGQCPARDSNPRTPCFATTEGGSPPSPSSSSGCTTVANGSVVLLRGGNDSVPARLSEAGLRWKRDPTAATVCWLAAWDYCDRTPDLTRKPWIVEMYSAQFGGQSLCPQSKLTSSTCPEARRRRSLWRWGMMLSRVP